MKQTRQYYPLRSDFWNDLHGNEHFVETPASILGHLLFLGAGILCDKPWITLQTLNSQFELIVKQTLLRIIIIILDKFILANHYSLVGHHELDSLATQGLVLSYLKYHLKDQQWTLTSDDITQSQPNYRIHEMVPCTFAIKWWCISLPQFNPHNWYMNLSSLL